MDTSTCLSPSLETLPKCMQADLNAGHQYFPTLTCVCVCVCVYGGVCEMRPLSAPLILTLLCVCKLLVCIDSVSNPLLLQTDLPYLLSLPRTHTRTHTRNALRITSGYMSVSQGTCRWFLFPKLKLLPSTFFIVTLH